MFFVRVRERKFVGGYFAAQKFLGQVWQIRAKILHTPKNLPAPTTGFIKSPMRWYWSAST